MTTRIPRAPALVWEPNTMALQVIFQFTENRGRSPRPRRGSSTQLSRVVFRDPDGQEIRPRTVTQPGLDGDHPPNEEPPQLLDPDLQLKWLTRRQPPFFLVFTFADTVEPHHLASYEIFTANDFPQRDPTGWELFLRHQGVMCKYDSQKQVPPVEQRFSSLGVFPLHMMSGYCIELTCRGESNTQFTIQFQDEEGALVRPFVVECQQSVQDTVDPSGSPIVISSCEKNCTFLFSFDRERRVTHYRILFSENQTVWWNVRWQNTTGVWIGRRMDLTRPGLHPLGNSEETIPSECQPQPFSEAAENWKDKLAAVYQQIDSECDPDTLRLICERAMEEASAHGQVIEGDRRLAAISTTIPQVLLDQLYGRVHYVKTKTRHYRRVRIRIGELRVTSTRMDQEETVSFSCLPHAISLCNTESLGLYHSEDYLQAMRLGELYDVTVQDFFALLGGLLASELTRRAVVALLRAHPLSLLDTVPLPGRKAKSALSG